MNRSELTADGGVANGKPKKGTTLLALACILLVLAGTGCKHTTEGAGDDIEEIGDDIEDAVD